MVMQVHKERVSCGIFLRNNQLLRSSPGLLLELREPPRKFRAATVNILIQNGISSLFYVGNLLSNSVNGLIATGVLSRLKVLDRLK
jgi:hypothetical protein